jgi:hypothetical protein
MSGSKMHNERPETFLHDLVNLISAEVGFLFQVRHTPNLFIPCGFLLWMAGRELQYFPIQT